jgi:uracil-DNA glycosylase
METWRPFLSQKWDKLKEVSKNITEQRQYHRVCPDSTDVFRALHEVALNRVKVVIVGQDPYSTIYNNMCVADGLAFSTQLPILPDSLRNLFLEISRSLEITTPPELNFNYDLSHWSRQGVLLLNTLLTVNSNNPLSHYEIGWQSITNHLLQTVASAKQNVVFIFMGSVALEIMPRYNMQHHYSIFITHPTTKSFRVGNKSCWKSDFAMLCNEYLLKTNQSQIQWTK